MLVWGPIVVAVSACMGGTVVQVFCLVQVTCLR